MTLRVLLKKIGLGKRDVLFLIVVAKKFGGLAKSTSQLNSGMAMCYQRDNVGSL